MGSPGISTWLGRGPGQGRLVSLTRDDIVSVDVKSRTLVLKHGLTITLNGKDVAKFIPDCPAFGIPFSDASSVYRKEGLVKALGLPPGCGARCSEASIPDGEFRSLLCRRNSMLRGTKRDCYMPWYVVSATLVEYSGMAVNWADEVAVRMMEALAGMKDGVRKRKFELEIFKMVNVKTEEEEARAEAARVLSEVEQLQLSEGGVPAHGMAGLGEAGTVGGELELAEGLEKCKEELVLTSEVGVVGETRLGVAVGVAGSASGEGNALVGGLGIGGEVVEDAALTGDAMLLSGEAEGTGGELVVAGSEEGGAVWEDVCVEDQFELNRRDLTDVVVELDCGPASAPVQVGVVVEGRQLRSREVKTTVVEKPLITRSVAKAAAQVLAKEFAEVDALCGKNEERCKQLEGDAGERQVGKAGKGQEEADAKAKADALANAEAAARAEAEAKAKADALANAEAAARAEAEAEAEAKAEVEAEGFNALLQAEVEKLAKANEEKNGLLRRFIEVGAKEAVAEQEKRGLIRQIMECSGARWKLISERENLLGEAMRDMRSTQMARLVKLAQMHVKRRKLEEVNASYEEMNKSHASHIWELEKAVVDQGYGMEAVQEQWQQHNVRIEQQKLEEAQLEASLAKAEGAKVVLEEEKSKLVVQLQEQHARMKLLRSKLMPENDIPDVLDVDTIEIEALLLAAQERDSEPCAGNSKRKYSDTDRDFRRKPQETERDVGGLRQRARSSENGGGKRALRGSSGVV